MKKLALLFLILAFFACCPRLTSTVTTSSDTTTLNHSDTATVLIFDTTFIAPILVHDTVNMSSFCDSLKRGLSPVIHLKVNHGSIKIKSDSAGRSEIECLTDSLIQVTINQQTTISNLKEQVINNLINKETVIEQPIYNNVFFWIVVGILLLGFYLLFRR